MTNETEITIKYTNNNNTKERRNGKKKKNNQKHSTFLILFISFLPPNFGFKLCLYKANKFYS